MLSLAELEEWLEDQWPQNLSELPQKISDTVYTYTEVLYEQLTKYGPPSIPHVSLNNLQQTLEEHLPSFSRVQPAPPPPPTRLERVTGWLKTNKYAIAGTIVASAVGLGLAYRKYPHYFQRIAPLRRGANRRAARVRNGLRREAVVVLGADSAIGRALTIHLASQDLIVIAAVTNSTSLRTFDQQLVPSSRGYVAVRYLDFSSMPESISSFAAEVHSTLALRFPLKAAGDPFARPGDNATLIGIVNALSYVPLEIAPDSMKAAGAAVALSQAMNQHVVGPLAAISALLPELRISPKRMFSANPECVAPVTIISLICKCPKGAMTQRMLSDAAKAGALGLREEAFTSPTSSRAGPTSQQRPLRMTVLEVSVLSPKSAAGVNPAYSARPSMQRSLSSTWHTKDQHTLRLQEKVADFLLPSAPSSKLARIHKLRGFTPVSWTGFARSYVPSRLLHWLETSAQLAPFAYLQSILQRGATRRRVGSSRAASTAAESTSNSQNQLVRSTASHGASAPAMSASRSSAARQTQDGLCSPSPYSQSATGSGTPSQVELEPPSNVDTGSSGDENGSSTDEGFILHSAPSSADGEEDARWRQGSPWFGAQGAASAATQVTSSTQTNSSGAGTTAQDLSSSYSSSTGQQSGGQDAMSASGTSSPALGASWVRLGESSQSQHSSGQQ